MSTRIFPTGWDWDDDRLVHRPFGEPKFADLAWRSFIARMDEFRREARRGEWFSRIYGELERPVEDHGDPKLMGWNILIATNDPQRDEIRKIMSPLARLRGLNDDWKPVLFEGQSLEEWFELVLRDPLLMRAGDAPRYLLIVGGPDKIPFGFQALLSATGGYVGRLDFDETGQLSAYVDKILKLESLGEPILRRRAVVFGTDAMTMDDPNYFSRRYMCQPLATYLKEELRFRTQIPLGGQATRQELLTRLTEGGNALLYTATHGLSVKDDEAAQRRLNGAVCCQRERAEPLRDTVFTAEDVPAHDVSVLEGGIWFQFACFGAGTPARSDFAAWDKGLDRYHGQTDFVAALPKALLAHPRGPIGFIGHVDLGWLHGFDDPEQPIPVERDWAPRLEPFRDVVRQLVKQTNPAGLALSSMSARCNALNKFLTDFFEDHRGEELDDAKKAKLALYFITRNDAQNYILLGDPAARLRISDKEDGAGAL